MTTALATTLNVLSTDEKREAYALLGRLLLEEDLPVPDDH